MQSEEYMKVWNALENINFWHERWKEQVQYMFKLREDYEHIGEKRYQELRPSAQVQEDYCYAKFKELVLIIFPIFAELLPHKIDIPMIDFPYHPFQDSKGIAGAMRQCKKEDNKNRSQC